MLSGPSACATNPQMGYDHRLPRTRRFVEAVPETYDIVAHRLLSCNALEMINSPVTAIVLVILGSPLIQVQVACEGLVVFQPPGWLRGRAGWVQGAP